MIARSFRLGAALGCILCLLSVPQARAVQACFSPDALSGEVTGICITEVPAPAQGTLLLGRREIRAGDILTCSQARELVFAPRDPDAGPVLQVSYLPMTEEGVQESALLSLPGRRNQPPIAEDSAAETYRNLENQGKLKVREPEEEEMTFSLVREPRRGTVEIRPDGSFTYVPKKNRVGTDSFVYTAADPAGNVSREATVTIEILKPTDAPQYVDTAGRTCSFAAEWMKHSGLFVGETLDGSPCFQPDRPVTRGEFLTMLVKSLDIPVDQALSVTGYGDEVPVWLRPYLAAAVRSGLTAPLEDQETFGADLEITPAAAAAMVETALDQPLESADQIALSSPDRLTRGQAAELIYALHRAKKPRF